MNKTNVSLFGCSRTLPNSVGRLSPTKAIMSDQSEDLAKEWALEIGSYITNFSYIELLVWEMFELLPDDPVVRSHKDLKGFSERARLLQALVRSSDWADKEIIESHLESALSMAVLRNNLAHNPLFIDVYIDGENVSEDARLVNSRNRKRIEHITLEELRKKREQLIELSTELAFCVGFIKG